MSDSENFVARWSRLKRDTAKEKTEADAARSDAQPSNADTIAPEQAAEGAPLTAEGPPKAPFDPATLPPIESITAASDIRAFLQTGVPAELTRAALRRVWTTDPAIRDFIGIAENQWDFTDPTAMPGFGPLEATDDVRQLVADAMGRLGKASEPGVEAAGLPAPSGASTSTTVCAPSHAHTPPQVAGIPDGNENDAQAGGSVEEQDRAVSAAPQQAKSSAESGAGPNRRAHGRALPQ